MKRSILLLTAAALGVAAHAQITTVVNYGGTNMITPVSPAWFLDLGGKGTGFDAGTVISPASNYAGQPFYGAVATSHPVEAPLTYWRIVDNQTLSGSVAGTHDWIQLSNDGVGTTAVDKHHYGLLLFKQADFLAYSTLAGGVTLTADTPLSYVLRRTGGNPSSVAFVLQTGTGYFITQPATLTNDQANGNALVQLANPSTATWRSYDPAASIATIGGAASPDLTNVLAIGLWFDNVRATTATASMNVNITSINFSAVPEPSTYALLGGLAALGLVLARRRLRG